MSDDPGFTYSTDTDPAEDADDSMTGVAWAGCLILLLIPCLTLVAVVWLLTR